jgi:ferritin-like metal-binding protein YciE
MSQADFKDLFVDELRDIYSAEMQLLQELPKMIEATEYPELKKAFQNHLTETQEQVKRLDKIFSELGESPSGIICEAMKGLVTECDRFLQKYPSSHVRDAALISAAQRIEHYEMAVYGTLRTFAKELGFDAAADLLQDSLNEEGHANKILMSIAQGGFFSVGLNEKAVRR